MNPFIALVLTFVIALAWLRLMDFAAHRGWIESHLSRKLIHIGTGPIFVLCWLLFPDVWYARWLAALVPLLITVQFAMIGLGIVKDAASVKAMSRSGDRREIPVKDAQVITGELESFGAGLVQKPVIMVASKIDVANKDKLTKLKKYCKKEGLELFPISAVTGKGIDELKYAMAEKVEQVRLPKQSTEHHVPSTE